MLRVCEPGEQEREHCRNCQWREVGMACRDVADSALISRLPWRCTDRWVSQWLSSPLQQFVHIPPFLPSSLPILLPSHSLAPDPNPPGYPGIHRNRLGGDKPFRSLPPSTSRKASAARFVAQPCCSSRQLGPGLDAERCSRCACVGYCLAKAPCDLLRPLCSFRELRHRPDRASIAAASGGQAWRGWTARAASPPAAARVRT
jgi:hypothetical protein